MDTIKRYININRHFHYFFDIGCATMNSFLYLTILLRFTFTKNATMYFFFSILNSPIFAMNKSNKLYVRPFYGKPNGYDQHKKHATKSKNDEVSSHIHNRTLLPKCSYCIVQSHNTSRGSISRVKQYVELNLNKLFVSSYSEVRALILSQVIHI